MFSQQWLLDPSDLVRERQGDFAIVTEEEYQKLFIFFSNCKFSKLLKTVQCVAIYFFYQLFRFLENT